MQPPEADISQKAFVFTLRADVSITCEQGEADDDIHITVEDMLRFAVPVFEYPSEAVDLALPVDLLHTLRVGE